MGISRKTRMEVYKKCDGHCGYCGKSITFEKMQVDHVIPKWWREVDQNTELGTSYKDPDRFENLVPACRKCNHYKRGFFLEDYRRNIATLHERVNKIYIVHVAKLYGIAVVDENKWDGKFYFEKKSRL